MNKLKTDPLKYLSIFFVLHFAIDMTFAIPLFIMPNELLSLLGWETIDPITARIVAAALFGIGIESLLGRKSTIEGFNGMLNLKIIWSFFAIFTFVISIIQLKEKTPIGVFVGLIIFFCFNLLWIFWKIQIKKLIESNQDNTLSDQIE